MSPDKFISNKGSRMRGFQTSAVVFILRAQPAGNNNKITNSKNYNCTFLLLSLGKKKSSWFVVALTANSTWKDLFKVLLHNKLKAWDTVFKKNKNLKIAGSVGRHNLCRQHSRWILNYDVSSSDPGTIVVVFKSNEPVNDGGNAWLFGVCILMGPKPVG